MVSGLHLVSRCALSGPVLACLALAGNGVGLAEVRTHTVVAVDDRGTPLGQITVGTTSTDHLGLLRWAARFGAERRAVISLADCSGICSRQENASSGCRRS
jgi:hypothetical protein